MSRRAYLLTRVLPQLFIGAGLVLAAVWVPHSALHPHARLVIDTVCLIAGIFLTIRANLLIRRAPG